MSNTELFSIFRDNMLDSMSRMKSNSLFWEFRYGSDNYTPLFTIKDEDIVRDGITYYSLKKIYMSYEHIPKYEYEFAMDVFGSWEHWTFLSERAERVSPIIKQWQEELEVKIKAKALVNIMKTGISSGNSAIQANKYLADKGWEVKAGRPTKLEKQRQLKQDGAVRENIKADMDRLGLSVVGGVNE